MTSPTAENAAAILALEEQIRHHDRLYWEKNTIEIPDAEYDALRARLKKLKPDHPLLLQTGEKLRKNEETVRHSQPMLSIEKCFTNEEIKSWAEEAGAFGATEQDGLVACFKVDGSSCSLVYENGALVTAATRGNGREGQLITRNALKVTGLPHRVPGVKSGRFEVRGEIYCSREAFEAAVAHFEKRLAEGKAKEDERPPNARNYCAGSLMLKDPREVEQRNLSFMAHGTVGQVPGSAGVSELQNLQALEALDFKTPLFRHVRSAEQIVEVTAAIDAKRDSMPYDIDGVVFTINRRALQDELGLTSHHPRYRLAFKFMREQGETTVNYIAWDTSRSGRVCPTLMVEPVHLGGATVSRCTAHNAKRVVDTNVGKGDRVLLEREVIPYFVRKLAGDDHGPESLPKKCPSCDSELAWDETDTNLFCPNLGGCPSQLQDYLEHYVSKRAANLEGVGPGLISKLIECGMLRSPADFYTLTESALLARKKDLEPMGEKLAKKVIESITAARAQPLDSFLISLGIKGLGPTAALKLAKTFGTLDKIMAASAEDLMKIEGFAETMTAAISRGLHERARIIEDLRPHLKIEDVAIFSGHLSGQSFCLTGHLEFDFEGQHYESRPDIEALIVSKGGEIKAVSKKLSYLVAGEGGGSKSEKAQKAGVKIIDAPGLVALLKAP